MQNRSELVMRSGLPLTILPLPTTSQNNQTVKARREVIPGAISSVSQTRVWHLLIGDLVVVIRCASGSTPSQLPARSLQRGARGLPSGLYALRAGSGPGGESTTARRGDLLTIGIDQ